VGNLRRKAGLPVFIHIGIGQHRATDRLYSNACSAQHGTPIGQFGLESAPDRPVLIFPRLVIVGNDIAREAVATAEMPSTSIAILSASPTVPYPCSLHGMKAAIAGFELGAGTGCWDQLS